MTDFNSSEIFDESLSSKVFDNLHLLEIIVNNLTWNCESNLSTRLINKSFNYLFLRTIRRNHRKMKIEFIGKPERCDKTAKDWIFINYRKIKKSIIPGYFHFLNKVVGVKVEEIITKNLWKPEEMFARNLHNTIYSDLIGGNRGSVRKLIGLEEVCEGCVDCIDMATRCVEYGPLRFQVLKEIKKPIHYRKLHISDKLLEIVANHCTLKSITKKKCFEKLNNIIRSSISCDTLLLWICETKEYYVNGVQENAHFSMPREVLDVMRKTWNVKTIRMNIIACTSEKICRENWIVKGCFTKIKLDDPYWKTGRSGDLKLKHVSVKVTDSYDCAGGLIYSNPKTGYEKSFENYIANLRRLFQMDKLSIDFSHWAHKYSASLEEFMRNILRVIQLEKQRKLEVNIQFFTEICSFKVGNSEELAEIPSEYSLLSDRVECIRMFVPLDVIESGPERLNMIKWVGRRFQVKDMDNHFTLNLNIYVKETELMKLDKGLMETHPNSLIGVFFPHKPLEISRKSVTKCPGAESMKIGLQSNVNDTLQSSFNSLMPPPDCDATQSFLSQKSFKNSPQTTAPYNPKPLRQRMTTSGADQIQNHSFSTKASPHQTHHLAMLQDVQQILDSSAILLEGQHEAAANVEKMQARISQIRDSLSRLFERLKSSAALFEDILEKMGSSSPLADRVKQMKLAFETSICDHADVSVILEAAERDLNNMSVNFSSIHLVCDKLCRLLTRERELQHKSAQTMRSVNENIEKMQKENLEMKAKIRESQRISKESTSTNNKEDAATSAKVSSEEISSTAPQSSSQKTSTTTTSASNYDNPTRQLLHESTMAVDSIVQKLKETDRMSGMRAELKETIANLITESCGLRKSLRMALMRYKGIDLTKRENYSVDQLVEKLGQHLQDNLILVEQINEDKKELKLNEAAIPNLGADVQERIKREIGGIASDMGAVKALRNKK